MPRLVKFLRLPLRHQLLLLEAALYVALALCLLRFIPCRRLAIYLDLGKSGAQIVEDADLIRAHEVGAAVAVAARQGPWSALCLPQAFAAMLMLRRRQIPSTLALGARIRRCSIEAHAWLRVGECIVTGGSGASRYRTLVVATPRCVS